MDPEWRRGIVATVTPPMIIRISTLFDPLFVPHSPDANTLMVFPTPKNPDGRVVEPVTEPMMEVGSVSFVTAAAGVVTENIPKAVRSEDLVRFPDESDTTTPEEDPVAKSGLRSRVMNLVTAESL
jgi:hypothetical protein